VWCKKWSNWTSGVGQKIWLRLPVLLEIRLDPKTSDSLPLRLSNPGNIYSTLPSLPCLHAQTAWIIISALTNTKYPIAWKKTQRISLFQAIHQDRISDKVNMIAERIHLINWVSKDEIVNRKRTFLQILVESTGLNDRLCDLHHTISVAIT